MASADLAAALDRIAVLERQASPQSADMPCSSARASASSPPAVQVPQGDTHSASPPSPAADNPSSAYASGQASCSGACATGLYEADAASHSSSSSVAGGIRDAAPGQPICSDEDEQGPHGAHTPSHVTSPLQLQASLAPLQTALPGQRLHSKPPRSSPTPRLLHTAVQQTALPQLSLQCKSCLGAVEETALSRMTPCQLLHPLDLHNMM